MGRYGDPSNTWFLGSTRVQIPNSITISSAVFLQSSRQTVTHPSLKNCPFPGGPGPPLIHGSLGPLKSSTQKSSQSVQQFLHRWLQRVPILYNGPPLPSSKLPLPMGDLDADIIHGSLGRPEYSTQMTSWSVQPILQSSLMSQTDRSRYSVSNNRPHLRMYYCDVT